MTFKERLRQEHPDKINDTCDGGCIGCPHSYGYEPCQDGTGWCLEHTCTECWGREIPSLKAATQTFGNHIAEPPYTESTSVEYVDTPEFANTDPHILDSGERRQFKTGAVRDIQEGKGRCDLMPLEVVAKILNGDSLYNPDLVVGRIALFKNSDYQETTHLYGALFHFAELWPNRLLGMTSTFADMFLEVAKHFEEGAKKYGENNWQKGLPIHCYINSAVRHYLKWLRGDTDEPHDRAFVWNVLCCIWECEFSPRATSGTEPDTPIMVLENVTKAQSNRVAYLCDRKACPKCGDPECLYTEDINHAVNFESVKSAGVVGGPEFIERHDSRLLLKSAVPGVYEMFGCTCLKGDDSVVYGMSTGCPINTTGLVYCQKLSLVNAYRGAEVQTLSTIPGGALFYHEDDVWLKTTMTNVSNESVHAVRLCDGKTERISGSTQVASVEDLSFEPC